MKAPDVDPVTVSALSGGRDGVAPSLVMHFPWHAQPGAESFRFEYSSNLMNWQPATFEVLQSDDAGTHTDYQVRVTGTVNEEPHHFFQMVVDTE